MFVAGVSLPVSLVHHVMLQEVHTRRRKEVKSKHYGTVKELTSEHQRFDQTEILSSLRKNGGYIHSDLGSRSVLVVRQTDTKISLFTEFSKSCNLASNAFSMFEYIFGIYRDMDVERHL